MRHDPKRAILADLLRRVDGLAAQRGHLTDLRLHDEVDQIRYIARAFHVRGVGDLASALQSRLSLDGFDSVLLSHLDGLRDAIARELPSLDIVASPRSAHATVHRLHA